MSTSAFDRIRSALDQLGPVKTVGNESVSARCPAHEDRNPSLSVRGIEGQVLLYCHAGCETTAVVAALGLRLADLFDNQRGATYRYDNGRTVHRSPDKKFRQADSGSPLELYRLSKVRAAVAEGRPVLVVEGEKDVHAAESIGLTATCSPMGAGKWSKIDPSPLYGSIVLVVADNDSAGMAHAGDVVASLAGKAQVSVWKAAEGKDLADHIAAGRSVPGELVSVPLETLPSRAGSPAAPPGSIRRLVLTPASEIKLRAARWLWDTAPAGAPPSEVEGRIPAGSLTIGAGRAGIGKSQHAAWLAAHITRGILPGCHYGTPRSVIYAASEDSWAMTIAPRLVAAGADLSRVFRIEVSDDNDANARLTLPSDTALLEQAIIANDVVLIVLDPLLSMIDAQINDYRAREVRDALEPLLPIADRTGCALLGLAHFTKATGSDPLLLIAGSGAFGQLVRAGIGYARDDSTDDGSPSADAGSRYVMSTIKSNLGREDLPSLSYRFEPTQVDTADGAAWVSRLDFTGTAARSVSDVLRDSHLDDEQRSERDEAADFIRNYLANAGGSAASQDVLKAGRAAGYQDNVLKKARSRAGARTERRGFGPGASWVWTIDRPGGKPSKEATDDDPHRCPIEAIDATPTNVESMESMAAPSLPDAVVSLPLFRLCGHPGDPATTCGTCIDADPSSPIGADAADADHPKAESMSTSTSPAPINCKVCGEFFTPTNGEKICPADDRHHAHARASS